MNDEELYKSMLAFAKVYSDALKPLNSKTMRFFSSDAVSNALKTFSVAAKLSIPKDSPSPEILQEIKSISHSYTQLMDEYKLGSSMSKSLNAVVAALQVNTMLQLSQSLQTEMVQNLSACFANAEYNGLIDIINDTLARPHIEAPDIAFIKTSKLIDSIKKELVLPRGFSSVIKALNKSTAEGIADNSEIVYDTGRKLFISGSGDTDAQGLNIISSGKDILTQTSKELFSESELIDFMTVLSTTPMLALSVETGKKIFELLNELFFNGEKSIGFDLSPAYDLLAAVIYPTTQELSFRIGGAATLDAVTEASFEVAAREAGLGARMAMQRYHRIQQITLHAECMGFAQFLKCRNLSAVHYEDFNYHQQLTEDDIECLQDNYFANSEEILRGFYRDNQLPEELLQKSGIEYLTMARGSDSQREYQFPENPVANRWALQQHIQKQTDNPISIVSVKVERSVKKGQKTDGVQFDLSDGDAREGALSIYSSAEEHGKCFCQMCRQLKPRAFIEVNNLQREPKYYFPQMRVALCLECSKYFESLRENVAIRKNYLEEIKRIAIGNRGKIEIHVGPEIITFTATHLAEIQEILKWLPEESIY